MVVGFCLLCGWLVVDSGVLRTTSTPATGRGLPLLQQTTDVDASPAPSSPQLQAAPAQNFGAMGGPLETVTIGSVDPNGGFMFQLELDSRGAAIRQATFSGFDNRDPNNPQPLVILSQAEIGGGKAFFSMANQGLAGTLKDDEREYGVPLGRLSWKKLTTEALADGGQAASFVATVVDPDDQAVLKLTKTYRVYPNTYLIDCTLNIENLTDQEQGVRYDLTGPVGLPREAFREDMRKVIGGFTGQDGQVVRAKLEKKNLKDKGSASIEPKNGAGPLLWAAAVNKYFAAILVPVPDAGQSHCDWVRGRSGTLYNPDGDAKANTGDETIGVDLSIATTALGPTGQADSSRTYKFQLYLGPKDKSLFDKNEMYRTLGFVQTIDFRTCCCPTSIISPLAFGILAIMKAMYGFIGNYGIVIIILVFLMRLVMHPITKKSQISMSKMSKLAPRAEEIKKKYAGNKTEMNKRLMELYREQGASPITGMLPMFVQMPIWIALWSAVYTSIDLRGAPFLPFWITDLSVPDALIRFRTITIPLLNWPIESLNLLPLLMGVAFYLQQKLMPTQANASTNPQMAQQQKMMMIMMPLMFPLMLYKAPSGVNLYIMSSTFAGVIEQYVIRKHIREKDEAESKGLVAVTSKTGGKVKKKKPKPFFKT
jgi:YidC/Oxa1 family membrane protein insertase